MANAYPELPHLEYQQTNVPMTLVVAYLSGLSCPLEVKRMAYIMFRNESGNGEHGVNNNYCGIQADGARWPASFDTMFSGTVTMPENGTGISRIFLAFHKWQDCVDMLVNRVRGRGLYIGEPSIRSENDLAHCYATQWVGHPFNATEYANFSSMYGQAAALFRNPTIENQQVNTNIAADDVSADQLNQEELEQNA